MKRNYVTLAAAAIIFTFGMGMTFLTGCEGPAGAPGEPGAPGADANESCIQCHNDETLVLARMVQASNSGHQTGTSFERNGTSCAPCHTHQGFLEVMNTGEMSTANEVSNPLPANCRTCHMIHENFDSSDFDLRFNDPVDLWINGVTVDLGGSGNICVSCHQPRVPSPMPEMGGGTVSITSSRWGPHHGTQSAMLYATAGYEIDGSAEYPDEGDHPHASAGCNVCHMAEPFGAFAGGHTFSMTYEYHGSEEELVSGCTGCHSGIEDFDLNGAVTEVAGLVENLRTALVSKGWVNENSGLVNASSSNPLELSADQAGILLNYYMIVEDASMGIHNPAYIKALLENSIAALN